MGLLNPNIPDQPQDNAQPNVAPDATVTPQAGGTTAPNLPPQTPTAPPNAQPTQPTPQLSPAQQQAQSQQAMSLHGKIFQNVLSTLAGGSQRPVRDQQGNPVTDSNGNVQMAPASKKVLAGSILAGAISGLLASMSQPRQFTQLPGGRMIEDTSRAIAAGAKAGQQFSAQGQKDIAQQQANDIQTRQYATIDHNLKLHMALMSNLKMQGDLLDAGTDEDSPLIEGLKTAPPIPDPKDPTKTIEPIQAQGVTEQQLLPLMKDGSVTRQSILRDGKVPVTDSNGKPVMNPDGTPAMQWTYTVYNQRAMVAMSDDMRGLNPALDKVSVGTPVPIAVLAKYALQNTQLRGAQQSVDSKMKDLADATGKQFPTFSLKTGPDANLIKSIYPWIAKYGTEDVDLMFKDLRAQKEVPGAAVAALQNAMGFTQADLDKVTNARNTRIAEDKKNDSQKPADPKRIQNAPALIKAKNTNLPAASLADYNSRLHAGMSNDELDKVMKDATAESEKITAQNLAKDNHDLNVAAKQDARIAKGEKPVVGIDANNRQVLVPAGDVTKYGLSQVREVGQAENEKVTNARSLMTVFDNDDPDDKGLIQLATELNNAGKLGPAASRFQNWLNKSGSVPTSLAGFDAGDPDVQRLFTKLGLSTTGLMQVHVGARGSAAMLEHFADLANAKQMSGNAFLAALDAENKYVKMKAMLPQTKQAQQVQQSRKNSQTQVVPAGTFNPNALPKAN